MFITSWGTMYKTLTIYTESDMYRLVITMEIGVEWNEKIITGHGEERKGEDVARHKRITCKEHSHTKNIE